ncbi:MAG: hypothetical protein MRY72_01290 [Aquisalinus sp.]|nr:hypothetical protein [Aquisalinus sp.]
MFNVAAILLVLQVSGLADYQAPSAFEAEDAFNRRLEWQLQSEGEQIPALSEEISSQRVVDFQLNKCTWGREQSIDPIVHSLPHNTGYYCRFRVFPLGSLDYADTGFFIHDGFQWRYFGNTRRSDIHDKQGIRGQPYSVSSASSSRYSPYVDPADRYVRIDPFSTLSTRNDRVITTYERDDHRRRRNMDDYVLYPKGTHERNRKGY